MRRAEAVYLAAMRDSGAARASRCSSLTLSGSIDVPLDGVSMAETAIVGVALPISQQPFAAAREDAAHAQHPTACDTDHLASSPL